MWFPELFFCPVWRSCSTFAERNCIDLLITGPFVCEPERAGPRRTAAGLGWATRRKWLRPTWWLSRDVTSLVLGDALWRHEVGHSWANLLTTGPKQRFLCGVAGPTGAGAVAMRSQCGREWVNSSLRNEQGCGSPCGQPAAMRAACGHAGTSYGISVRHSSVVVIRISS